MKISVVMSYYNRKQLLLNTLESFKQYDGIDYEVIVVDDASSDEHRLEDVPGIKLIRVDPEDKTWVNPCIPFNMGFSYTIGDVVVLQNPECRHEGNILQYVMDNISDDNYLAFGCISLNKDGSMAMWYNHSVYRPCAYHFCSAITKKNLTELGGFDERYKDGTSYDDDEFILRVKRKGLNVMIVDTPLVSHQCHHENGWPINNNENVDLYRNVTLKEVDRIKVNE